MIEIRSGMKIKTGQFAEIWKGIYSILSGFFFYLVVRSRLLVITLSISLLVDYLSPRVSSGHVFLSVSVSYLPFHYTLSVLYEGYSVDQLSAYEYTTLEL
jgi:hypothetical protein